MQYFVMSVGRGRKIKYLISRQCRGIKITVRQKQKAENLPVLVLHHLYVVFTFGALCVPEIIGIVFGIMAIRDKLRKHGLAVAGLIMSMIGTAMFILWIFI